MERKLELSAAFLALIVLAPVLYHLKPIYIGYPDILYVKAKVLWVLEGALYTDPITGYANFHPPVYHLFLSLFVRLGIQIDTVLLVVSIVNTCLTILLSCLIVHRIMGPRAAFWTVALFPFVMTFMGFGGIFLSSSFHFSVPFYLAGLWIYAKPALRSKETVAASILWGLAFLISPVYVFLIGFTLVYELFIRRDYRRAGVVTGVFLLVIIPFFVQAVIVYRAGMGRTETFAFWRGLPDLKWVGGLASIFLSPVEQKPLSWPVIPAAALSILGTLGIWKRRPIHPYPAIAALAYIFTAYHFSFQYAIRIQYFLSLFLVAYAAGFLKTLRIHRVIVPSVLCLVAGIGFADHFIRSDRLYEERGENVPYYQARYEKLSQNLPHLIEPGEFVLATANTYRYFIMPFCRAHGLVAYRSGEYFQLHKDTAQTMLQDYKRMLETGSRMLIEHLCDKYDITVCVVRRESEADRPGFRAIGEYWDEVYRDSFFTVYRRPTEK